MALEHKYKVHDSNYSAILHLYRYTTTNDSSNGAIHATWLTILLHNEGTLIVDLYVLNTAAPVHDGSLLLRYATKILGLGEAGAEEQFFPPCDPMCKLGKLNKENF